METRATASGGQEDAQHHASTDRPVLPARPAALAYDLALRHKQGVSLLLAHRDDLRGVHAYADILEEAVRWSA